MSSANRLNVSTKEQDRIDAGDLAVSALVSAGGYYQMYAGQTYNLNVELGAGAAVLNLPAKTASAKSGLRADIYYFASVGNANDPLLQITSETGEIVFSTQVNQVSANSQNGNVETGGANSTSLSVKTSIGSGDDFKVVQTDNASSCNGIIKIRSVGVSGYSVEVKSTNSTCSIA